MLTRRTWIAPAAAFIVLLAALWIVAEYFGVAGRLRDHLPSSILSIALLLGPYWAFGFGFGDWLDSALQSMAARALAPVLLVVAYPVFTVPRGQFQWVLCLALSAAVLSISAILTHARSPRPDWHDYLVLVLLALAVELHIFDRAWPVPGLTAIPKLLFVDTALYGYLVIRRLPGVGFDFRPRRPDFKVGFREFLYYTPVALALGFLVGFLHFHKLLSNPLWFGSGWLFTLLFIAVPEELFFRGLLLNMLEKHVGTRRALWITAIVFGLAHFNKRAAFFNWRYVLLAAVAGYFYGRDWLARRRILTSSITHATVDTVWSIWLR